MQNNRGKIKVESTAKKKKNPYKDDVLYSPMGQWQYPGQITKIPSEDITMKGVPYPVVGIDDLGYSQMMYPDGRYNFPGKYVTEYPQMAYGGTPKRGQIYDRLGRLHSIKSYVPFAKNGGSNTNTMSYNNFKGRKGPFPQIQTEAEFFSPAYWNIESPYSNGSLKFGGFPTFSTFPTQPTKKEFGNYGRPNWPYFIAQMGGTNDNNVYKSTMQAMGTPDYMDTDIFANDIDAYTGAVTPKVPIPGAGYQWPIAADAPIGPMNYTDPGTMNMGGQPCYNCGGSYKKMKKAGGAADINQGPDFFTKKQNDFLGFLRNTAFDATSEEMGSQFLMKKGGSKNWIQNAVNPAHKGYCTPMTKSTCTPRRKAFAMTMKKHHGFHKQDGGEAMQEAKWQAIIALVEQGVTDPSEIANQLNQEGTYQTNPEEVQGYLEEYSQGEDSSDYMRKGGAYAADGIQTPSGLTYDQFAEYQDKYLQAHPQSYSQGLNPQLQSYNQPGYRGYGLFPANSNPFIKIKNKNYFNGASQAPTDFSNLAANPSIGFPVADNAYGNIKQNYGRGFLGLGPTRLKSIDYSWGMGNQSPTQGTPTQLPGKSGRLKGAYATNPAEIRQVGRTPEGTGFTNRPESLNILGRLAGKFKGNPYAGLYRQFGGDSTYVDPTLAFQPSFDPSQNPENLPGFTGYSPMSNETAVQAIGDNPEDQVDPQGFNASGKGRIKFGNRMNPEDQVNWGIAGMNAVTGIFNAADNRKKQALLNKRFKPENFMTSNQNRDRGDYTSNNGYFRPDQQSTGSFITGKYGGSYKEGGEYDLSDEEIADLKAKGYKFDIL